MNDPFFGFDLEVDAAGTDVAFQPGGGVVLWLNRRVGIQATGHYRRTLGFSVDERKFPSTNEFRFATGVTIGFGGDN